MDTKNEQTRQTFLLDTANDDNANGRPKARTTKLAKVRRQLPDSGCSATEMQANWLVRTLDRFSSVDTQDWEVPPLDWLPGQQEHQRQATANAECMLRLLQPKVDNSYNTRNGIAESITTAGHLSPSPNFMKRGNHRGKDTDRLSVDTRPCPLLRRCDPASLSLSVWSPG